jgi:Zn ribbon nucleic-acid-binding protein
VQKPRIDRIPQPPVTYRDQFGRGGRTCPYCLHYTRLTAAECDEIRRVVDCVACGKKYYTSEIVYVSSETNPNCELNGETHDYPEDVSVCRRCQHVRPMPKREGPKAWT